jgi:hypothetical protein
MLFAVHGVSALSGGNALKPDAMLCATSDGSTSPSPLFQSFFLGGFECSTHCRLDGRRLDLLHSTRHDTFAATDYRAMANYGIGSVRDGLRWHLIEKSAGFYDWSSFIPQLRAAQQTGMQVAWDICHYGWPDDIDIWSTAFVDRFARFAGAVASLVRDECAGTPLYCPMNEISFLSWAGADTGDINPCVHRRGMELKCQLVRATAAAVHAMRDASPRARFVSVDPVINVVPKTPRQRHKAENGRRAQYQAWDMLAGKSMPELGGSADLLDVIGVNFYSHNQWYLGGRTIRQGEPNYRPLREILAEVHDRYRRPLFIAETGAEGERRVPWLCYVCDEVAAALVNGVPVEGICIYPITDYPGWDNDRHCPSGLLGMADAQGHRPVYDALATELALQQERFRELRQDRITEAWTSASVCLSRTRQPPTVIGQQSSLPAIVDAISTTHVDRH